MHDLNLKTLRSRFLMKLNVQKRITLLFLSNSGMPFKQMSLSFSTLSMILLGCCVGLVIFGFWIADYLHIRKIVSDAEMLRVQIVTQEEEIIHQRDQIQEFALQINELKSKLQAMNEFEQKIRIIANLDEKRSQENVFGIGGSLPEDLNSSLELNEKHNSLIREMHDQVDHLNLAAHNQMEEIESLYRSLEDQRNLLASTPAIRPMKEGWITSSFGYRISPFTGQREFHKGLDIAARQGTSVLAPANGIVTFVGKKGLLGNVVVIDHAHGMVTRYAHLKKALVKKGQKVKRGDMIAEIGNTGRSTGPHLHYEVMLNGIPVNPEKYILN